MTGLKAQAVKAAIWISKQGSTTVTDWSIGRAVAAGWQISTRDTFESDEQLIARAKSMGWNPEPTDDPAPVFPKSIVWKADGPFDTARAAAVRKALSGPSFASFTPEQRAQAMQAAISFDIHCKPETAITPVVEEDRIALEIRTGTHLTTLNVAGKGGGT